VPFRRPPRPTHPTVDGGTAPTGSPTPPRDRGGFIVFGIILGIVGTFTAAVLIGVLMDRARQGPPPTPLPRQAIHAAVAIEVRFGALTTRRFGPGDRLWVGGTEGPELSVFESERGNRIIGFVPAASLTEAPGAAGAPRRSRAEGGSRRGS
jgi:hypothetical protein